MIEIIINIINSLTNSLIFIIILFIFNLLGIFCWSNLLKNNIEKYYFTIHQLTFMKELLSQSKAELIIKYRRNIIKYIILSIFSITALVITIVLLLIYIKNNT